MWFGEPWPAADDRALICADDRRRVDTPVGSPCFYCQDLIDERDQGVYVPALTDGPGWPEPTSEPAHVRCLLLGR
jgi:hypothetical protein